MIQDYTAVKSYIILESNRDGAAILYSNLQLIFNAVQLFIAFSCWTSAVSTLNCFSQRQAIIVIGF